MALTKTHNRMIAGSYVNVVDYGATGDGLTNDYIAINSALADADHLFFPSGTYICDTMLEVGAGKVLQLAAGAIIKRSSSGPTDPVIWLKGGDAGIFGAGTASEILSDAKCPNGVVRIGMADMTSDHGSVNNCTVKDVWIAGSTQYGQTSGAPDAALNICNPQLSTNVSYFHTIENVSLANANYGLWLQGWANANKISNIFMQRIGNTSLSSAMLFVNGGLDNVISNIFFHGSSNTTAIKLKDLDNTGVSGGNNHVCNANAIMSWVAEQGGASAKSIEADDADTSGVNNVIIGVPNTALIGTVGSTFRAGNTLLIKTLVYLRGIKSEGDGDVVTISAGSATIVDRYHLVAAETGTTDNLDNVLNGAAGDVLVIGADAGDTITVRDNGVSSGNITLDSNAAFAMTGGDRLSLIYDGSFWRELSRSDN